MEVKKGIIVLIIFFLLINCKKNENNKTQEKQEKQVESVLKKEIKDDIYHIQGVWENYSYYLEHESEFKDFNKNKYYKIIFNKRSLDIRLGYQDIDSLSIKKYYLGFWESTKKPLFNDRNSFIKSLKDSGNILVRFNEDVEEYNYSTVEKSTDFERYHEVTEILHDGFSYDKKTNEFDFRRTFSLPKKIFSSLKEKSKLDNIDYIKDYGIHSLSKKVRVKVGKTYFHNEMDNATRRKAFLVKGDEVYVEEILDAWVKVYYDGKIISGGYVKKSDLEINKI